MTLKTWKPVSIKRMDRQNRELRVLLGVVDYYIHTGKPVGSNTLKETGFEDLSSATIRNYFSNLEQAGYLTQSHSSGGRIPTFLAYKAYAKNYLNQDPAESKQDWLHSLQEFNSREITLFLQQAADTLSQVGQCAVFLSAPRFDHDFVINIKLVSLDAFRCLCILITDFGVIRTEILRTPEKLSLFTIKHIENYFQWRLKGGAKPENLEPEEEALGQAFYNELMLRYIVGYSNFINEDIYCTGFSRLLTYPDFQDTRLLASGLALFENMQSMRLLLKECVAFDRLHFWIGEDLNHYVSNSHCSVLAIPYYINRKPVGAVGILGPMRFPYRLLFNTLKLFSGCVSETLTRNIYKFKINFRQPEIGQLYLQKEENKLIGQSRLILLEDKRG